MKINQWTLGLAAVGVVSLASAVNAEEAKMNALQTALSSTTISGYVDTSVEWALGNKDDTFLQDGIPFRGFTDIDGNTSRKGDGFNLNVVKLSIEKPMDESEWASGYKVDLLFGPDAVNYNASANSASGNGTWTGFGDHPSSDFAIKQAYVALRTPVGNGIDWKLGTFDTVIGYETFEAGNNPNFTRSWGYAVEPTQHTGILGTYRVNDMIAVAAGVANTLSAQINDRNYNDNETWHKTAMGSVAITAPQDMGFLSGSTLYAGAVVGVNNAGGTGAPDQGNYYIGATLNTPVAGLKAGLAYDYVDKPNFALAGSGSVDNLWIVGAYVSYQATEKMSVHGRAEYGQVNDSPEDVTIAGLTGTVQYDLWKNVISRLELRWDQAHQRFDGETGFTATGVSLYANFIYKF